MPETQEPISVKDFANRVKAKYPEYKDVDDTILAKKMVEKYPEYKDQVSFEVIKKKELTPSVSLGGISPLQEGYELASGAVLGKIKSIPQSIQEGVQKDKSKPNNWLAAKWNDLVGVISNTFGGVASLQEKRYNAGLERAMQLMGEPEKRKQEIKDKFFIKGSGEEIKSKIEGKLRSSASSMEYEKRINEFDLFDGIRMSDLGGMLNSAPSQVANMLLAVPTKGANYFLQTVGNSVEEIEKLPGGKNMTESEKLLYATTNGFIQAAAEKLAIDKILNKTGVGDAVKKSLTKQVLDKFIKKGAKASVKEIEEEAFKVVAKLPSKIKRSGLNTLYGAGVESITEATQSALSDGLKLATNAVKEKEIFDESDIRKNFWKNVGNSAAAGGLFGGVLAGGSSLMTNTNKAIRNEISKSNDLESVQQKIAEQVELGNITEDEASKANITAQQYAQIASKIPKDVTEEQKYKIIGGIEQRENLTKEIENTKKEISNTDPAFQEDANNRLELLEAKFEQTEDYLNDLVKGKKTTYRKETDGEKTTYYKTDANGEETKISREYYDLATAIREENAAKKAAEKEQTIVEETAITEQPPTLLEEDVRESEMIGEPKQISQPIALSTEIKETPSTPISKEGSGSVEVVEPTQQEIINDVKNKNFTTVEYKSESEIPDVWKDKVTSSGETNGEKIFRITLPTAQFEYESRTGVSKKVNEYPAERKQHLFPKPIEEGKVEGLKDVDSTAKALEDKYYEDKRIGKEKQLELIDLIPKEQLDNPNQNGFYRVSKMDDDWVSKQPKEAQENIKRLNELFKDRQKEQVIAEAYHKAKADGSNPKLVKAVEDLIGKNETTPTQVSKPTETKGTTVTEVSEVIEPAAGGEVIEPQKRYEEISTIKSEKIRTREKGKFVDDHFESIVSQLMLKNKIKRIC